jgi:hypothetical protein
LAAVLVLVSAQAIAAQEADLEMLEYLGSWQTEDGSAVDPFQLDEMRELEPELERTDVKAGGHAQKSVEDRAGGERRARKPAPAAGAPKDATRRDASTGGGHD